MIVLMLTMTLLLTRFVQDDSIDTFQIAFVQTYFGPGGLPVIGLANVSCTLFSTAISLTTRALELRRT